MGLSAANIFATALPLAASGLAGTVYGCHFALQRVFFGLFSRLLNQAVGTLNQLVVADCVEMGFEL